MTSSTDRSAPATLVALEEERDFCLRSLRDLDAEFAAGDLEQADYETLRDAYVARAAAALRQLVGREPDAATRPAGTSASVAFSAPGDAAGSDKPASLEGAALPADAGGSDPAVGSAGLAEAGAAAAAVPQVPTEAGAPAAAVPQVPTEAGAAAAAGPRVPAGADGTDGPIGSEADDTAPSTFGTRVRWRRRLLIGAGVVVVAIGAAWAVAASSGTRLPGQEITGQAVGSQAEAQDLQQAQQAADRGDGVTALKDYQKVLNSDPSQPEALTGEGWLLAQTQQPTLLQQGLTMLTSAEQAAPTYAPAHLYRGIALLSEDNYASAIPELQWYLAHDPDPQLAPKVRTALQQAEARAASAKGGG